jgi:hypothetical protein
VQLSGNENNESGGEKEWRIINGGIENEEMKEISAKTGENERNKYGEMRKWRSVPESERNRHQS